jgi:hypothetical protein
LSLVAGGKVLTKRVFVGHIGGCTSVKCLVYVVQAGSGNFNRFRAVGCQQKEFGYEQGKSLKMIKGNSFYRQNLRALNG